MGAWSLHLKDDRRKIYHIDWSPDSRFVAFSRGPESDGDLSKPGTFQAACEIVGVYAKDWNICAVSARRCGVLDLNEATGAEFVQLTGNGAATRSPPGSGRTGRTRSRLVAHPIRYLASRIKTPRAVVGQECPTYVGQEMPNLRRRARMPNLQRSSDGILARHHAPVLLQLLVLIGIAVALPSCEKPDAPGSREVHPLEAVSKSGVEMVYLPGGEFLMGSTEGNPDEGAAAQGFAERLSHGQVSGDAGDVRQGAVAGPVALAGQPEKPGRARPLARRQAVLQRAFAPGGAEALLQREDAELGLRRFGRRLPPAHRGRMGVCRRGRAATVLTISDRRRSCGSMPGSPTTPSGRRIRSGRRSRTAGGSTTCTATCRNGARTSIDAGYYRTSPAADPQGPPTPGRDVKRVLRGGNWKASAAMCRAATARPSAPAIRTPVSPAIIAGCVRAPPRSEELARLTAPSSSRKEKVSREG